jgi:hypothetical protein
MRVLLTLLLLSTCVAQEQTALLTGTVVDATNARIPSATVQLDGPSGATKTVHVDKEGVFEFRGLSPGMYQLQIYAQGFVRQQIRDIQIGPGEQRKLAVALRVAPLPKCHEQICL